MFTTIKKLFHASILILVISLTGIWQSGHVAFAQGQNADFPETPLHPGLIWINLGPSSQDIRINVDRSSVSLTGERFMSTEEFVGDMPQDVLNYYSNEQLARSGWESHDAFNGPDGMRYVFSHASGVYLVVEYVKCPGDSYGTCVSVWKSEPLDPAAAVSSKTSEPEYTTTTTGTFGKKSPAKGATNVNPVNVVLSWNAYSPAPDKYSYCINEGSACEAGDPDWTSTYDTSVTIPNLSYNKTYYWQVKAITCVTCVPKTYVYADNGDAWTFKTKQATQAIIVGNAGVVGAVISYVDGSPKTVTADGYGAYLISVPLNWSGTITPTKTGYVFSPRNASFTNLTALQTIQNFNAVPGYIISGNTGISGVTLSYTEGTPQTVTSGDTGHYSFTVPADWSGTVIPSKTGFTFSPPSKDYINVATNQTAQNYTPLVAISGNAGMAGVTLDYVDDTAKTATANGLGDYTINVPFGWTGTVTPHTTGFTFSPVSRSYTNLKSNQTGQNYTAVDNPVVLSSVRMDSNPTSASSVDFKVTFSETVFGVDSGDFGLAVTGLTGATITNVNGSGAIYTVTVSTGSGSGTIRLDVVDDDSIVDVGNKPLGGAGSGNGGFTSGELYEVNMATVLSTNTADGWILESSETSSRGGTKNNTAATLRIGDDAANKQYRSILSFDTSVIPDEAVITSVTLKFKYEGKSGTLPFLTHGGLLADIRKGAFNGDPALQLGDFSAKGTLATYKFKVLIYTDSTVAGWYSQSLQPADFTFVNLGGVTQFRLRFATDDNNDHGADFLRIHSGNALLATDRPQLIVEYHLP